MKKIIICILLTLSASAYANEKPSEAIELLEKKLQTIEYQTAKLISAKNNFSEGIANLGSSQDPKLGQVACDIYPIDEEKSTIKKVKKDITYLSKKKNLEKLNEAQAARLAEQKSRVDSWQYGLDCAALLKR